MKVKIIKNNPPVDDYCYLEASDISKYIGQIFEVDYDYKDGELDVNFNGGILTVFPSEYEIVEE